MARPRPTSDPPRTPYCSPSVGTGPARLLFLLLLPLVLLPGCLGTGAEPAPVGGTPVVEPTEGDFWAGLAVPFAVVGPGGGEVRWEYGDNTTGTGAAAPHVYAQPGVYAVTVHADGASSTLLVPVHWRESLEATVEAPRREEGPRVLERIVPLWPDVERSAATLDVRVDRFAALGASVTFAALTPDGRVLASTRAVVAGGGNETLTLVVPGALLTPGDPHLLYRVTVEGGAVSLDGHLEARSRDPR